MNKSTKILSQRDTVAIGDNLTFLKNLTTKSIFFDVIYIDPPYNTGNKFSYNDSRDTDEWVIMITERLVMAKEILKDDGVIFISIDDSSLYELKLTCDRIFGKSNFIGSFITKQAMRSNSKHINTIHEYIVVYAKNKKKLNPFKIKRINSPKDGAMIKNISNLVKNNFELSGEESAKKLLSNLNSKYMKERHITWLRNYSQIDGSGDIFFPKDLSVPGTPSDLIIEEIGLNLPALPTRKWSSAQKIIKLYNENKIHYKNGRPYEKHYLKDSYDNVSSILDFYSRQGTNDLARLDLRGLFDTPKPVELIKYLIRISTHKKNNALILDFFAGSGTTGQAVMEINIEDDKQHSFYLCQLDENISHNTAQYEFASKNNIQPSVDQLMIFRLNKAREILNYPAAFKIERVK